MVNKDNIKSELIRLVKSACMVFLFCVFIAAAVAVLLRTPFLAEQKAYLFRLLYLTAMCCAVLLLIGGFAFLRRQNLWGGVNILDYILSLGIATLGMSLFFSLGPMPIERSYTVYTLADMTDREGIYSSEDIKRSFIEGYIEGANESKKRIDEQVYLGNLEEVPGGYQITEKGKNLIKLFRSIEVIFPVPDKNSIYPNGVHNK